ncbi:hypothetical protein GCM10009670_29290 [Citricoccus alkalitolerans]
MRLTTAMSRMRERKSTVRCAKRWTGWLNSGSTMGIGGVLLSAWGGVSVGLGGLRRASADVDSLRASAARPGSVQRIVRAILAGYR